MQAFLDSPSATSTNATAVVPVDSIHSSLNFKMPPPEYRISQDSVPHYVTFVPKGRKVGSIVRLGYSSGGTHAAGKHSLFPFLHRFRNEVTRCLLFVFDEKSFQRAQTQNYIPLPYEETLSPAYRRLLERRSRPNDPKPFHYNLNAYKVQRKLQKELAAAAAAAAANTAAKPFTAGATCMSDSQQPNSQIRAADNVDILNASQHSNK